MKNGQVAYHGGLAAEEQVARHYRDRGAVILAQRWRVAGGGEIDLIVRHGDVVVFVEVKQARTIAIAAERLGAAQLRRIGQAAEVYAARHAPDAPLRFDLALVDGVGRIEVIENATLF